VWFAPRDGSAPRDLGGAPGYANALAANDATAFLAVSDVYGTNGQLVAIDADGTHRVLVAAPVVEGVVADDASVYWGSVPPPGADAGAERDLFRAAHDGSGAVVIASASGQIYAMTLGGGFVYWSASEGYLDSSPASYSDSTIQRAPLATTGARAQVVASLPAGLVGSSLGVLDGEPLFLESGLAETNQRWLAEPAPDGGVVQVAPWIGFDFPLDIDQKPSVPVRSERVSVARVKSAVLEVSIREAWPSIFVRRVRRRVRAAKSSGGSGGIFVHDSGERLLGASNFVYGPSTAVRSVKKSMRRVVTAVMTLKSPVLEVMSSDWVVVLADQEGHDLRLGGRTRRS
jgi:hypothetical protein